MSPYRKAEVEKQYNWEQLGYLGEVRAMMASEKDIRILTTSCHNFSIPAELFPELGELLRKSMELYQKRYDEAVYRLGMADVVLERLEKRQGGV